MSLAAFGLCLWIVPGALLLLALLLYNGPNGQLHQVAGCPADAGSGPEAKWIWAAKDEDAFRMLQALCGGSVAAMQ